jgi:membrane associated rhomboid family serine protease
MLPLSDHNPRHTTPVINYLLIAVNVAMFVWELSWGDNLERALYQVAFVPAGFWMPGLLIPNLVRIFVSMFLHGSFLHIAGNLLYLWIFGDNIEDRLGHFRYLIFYLACGFVATMSHAFVNPGSTVPAIGASGAIAGVLGAYLILFPHAKVTTLIPLFVFITIRELPAIFVLGFWFVLQLFTGVGSLADAGQHNLGGVAYFAHVGGFVCGMILILLLGGRRARRPPPPAAYPPW